MVPVAPGFPLRPHDGFPPCVKPTSRDRVVPLRAPPGGDFHPFTQSSIAAGVCWFQCEGTSPHSPVSASPSLTTQMWIGSNQALQPGAPVVAVRAQLRAYGYSACSAGIGDPDLTGLVVRSCPFGAVTVVSGAGEAPHRWW